MPAARRKTSTKTAKAKPKSAATPAMSSSQKTIYAKLKRKGMSDKQAHAFSKHAAKRKDGAAAKKTAKAPKRTASKSSSRKVTSRGKK